MQYGDLTTAQITKFNAAQAHSVREPSFVLWIEGFGDPTEYVMEIDAEVALESARGRGYLNIGRAVILMNNEGDYFYADGKSKIEKNARMKIWAGFDNFNIPIFTGIVNSVEPTGTTDVVTLSCYDYMQLFRDMLIKGSQDPNNTAKLLIEHFCDLVNIPTPVIASTGETTSVYTDPEFEEQVVLRALGEVCNSIFYVAYFDEDGYLHAAEREHSTLVDWAFSDSNVIDCQHLVDTEIINDITAEYEDNFFSIYTDQASIDAYGTKARSDRTLLLNSTLVSDKTQGATTEELNYDLEAFKFTSVSDAAIIDCLHIKMKKDGAHGYITVKIYSDIGGIPSSLLATSQLKAGDNLYTEFAWEIFYFSTPVQIQPSTDYWVVIDTTSVDIGAVYVQISAATATAKHAYYSGGWVTENNKQILHRIRGSMQAQRVAQDVVRFYKDPHERIRVTAPAVPQLQLLDEVVVDIALRQVLGHYVVVGRRHILKPDSYTTIDTLRKV